MVEEMIRAINARSEAEGREWRRQEALLRQAEIEQKWDGGSSTDGISGRNWYLICLLRYLPIFLWLFSSFVFRKD